MTTTKELFDHLNRRLFYGHLPSDYRIETAPRRSGALLTSEHRGAIRKAIRKIWIAADLSPEEQRRTLLHEMCHAASPKRNHGEAWQAEMWRISQLGEAWAAKQAADGYGANFACLELDTPESIASPPPAPRPPAARRMSARELRTELEEARGLCRRANRALAEREVRQMNVVREYVQRKEMAVEAEAERLLAVGVRIPDLTLRKLQLMRAMR